MAAETRSRCVAADSHCRSFGHASVLLDYEWPNTADREQSNHYSGSTGIRLPT